MKIFYSENLWTIIRKVLVKLVIVKLESKWKAFWELKFYKSCWILRFIDNGYLSLSKIFQLYSPQHEILCYNFKKIVIIKGQIIQL